MCLGIGHQATDADLGDLGVWRMANLIGTIWIVSLMYHGRHTTSGGRAGARHQDLRKHGPEPRGGARVGVGRAGVDGGWGSVRGQKSQTGNTRF